MNIATRLRKAALALACATLALGPFATAAAQSMPSATMPPHPKALAVDSLRLPANAAATVIRLEAPDAAAVDELKRANARALTKRLRIGMNRPLPSAAAAHSAALEWVPVDNGWAARWAVTSEQARALRVGLEAAHTLPGLEIRFAASASPDTVYGPFRQADLEAAAGATFWSPVLEGPDAVVELFVPGPEMPRALAIAVRQVSHLLASPADPKAEGLLKIGDSGSCEVNLICRSSSDGALAKVGKAVARMTFSDATGTFLCTGTLLNSGGGQFVPYFYTADHCIDDQNTASTLTTHWFYDSTTCVGASLNPGYEQVPGGATLLYVNSTYDVSFMRLNRSPPSGAVFAGWDAAQISNGTALTAIHHPRGDVKKVSLGTMGGYTVPSELGRTVAFIQSNWIDLSTGVTEGGSSGSGIFTVAGGEYWFRGGLLGGPSSCTATRSELFDWYSRFDVAYQSISQYLNAAAPASNNYTALWWNPSESGWGINVTHQGDIAFATLFTYDNNGPMWLVMSRGDRVGGSDTFSGTLYRTTGSPFNQTFTGATPTPVGSMTLTFSDASNGTLAYNVNDTAVFKTITKQLFGPTGAPKCQPTSGSRASATNYTDLWWNAPAGSESGWGINLTQQGSIMFATLFTYAGNGQGLWFVMSRGDRQADGSFTGALYQMSGPPFNAQPWPGATPNQVGSMTLRFGDGENGTLSYTVNGTRIDKPITRQVFAMPAPFCS